VPIVGELTIMRKLIALAAVLTFVFLLPALVAASEAHKSTPHVSGTITSWDGAGKQATVKDSAGKETSFGWNDTTKVTGMPKVGEHASVSYTKDKEGKNWATHISIGAKTASAKPPAAK
jgi:hypothetical protein